nr:hypothetical protein [Mycolicibacterium baixiangningiae]
MLIVGTLNSASTATAVPSAFPDLDTYPSVDASPYQVFGAHPSTSGWVFSTPSGLRCQASLIADLGVFCTGPVPGTRGDVDYVAASLTRPGVLTRSDIGDLAGDPFPLLPTGAKIAAGNGVECAVISDDGLACLAKKPDSWSPDTPAPPDREYGEHGFVVRAQGSWTF